MLAPDVNDRYTDAVAAVDDRFAPAAGRYATAVHVARGTELREAAEALRGAAAVLGESGAPIPGHDRVRLDSELATTAERLRARLLAADGDGPGLAEVSNCLARVHEVRYLLHDSAVTERLRRMEQLDTAIAELHRERTTAGVLDRLCRTVAEYCEFDRVLLSRVDRSIWSPWRSYARVVGETEERFRSWMRTGPRIRLDHLMPESDIVRRGRAVLVTAGDSRARVPHELVAAANLTTYVAVPLLPGNRVIGFLHADRTDRPVGGADRDVLASFGGRFDRLFEHISLVERLTTQRNRIRGAIRAADTLLDELGETELDTTTAPTAAPMIATPHPEHDRLSALTGREREVLALLATGASNARIAETLVITGDTVKFHVKRVLRKLRAENRAEAAALYLRLTVGRPDS